ncbi:bifunctional UDP-N-acetylglucosamine diphosphorylase/glucosamine-1-phosphate N-acetyltransferase GlmU [Leuconostoc lactis]|uniref:bifunctional UDP-N-acetylglucosamine diphosphorylase/glucosamine-1-phosphate N-acetyltransferase GlmU n=1 Tax=Lactobacillaceae TaxID=33958 RepID=UPI000E904BAB|nr:bifunctional UDP-N-acetylglucosamine diphosphorylase/glucosamine-1-phosphate N-acetyltransferase GlmU [Leuconostoc lactis]QEA46917.1 bifunctional UDP-N-acetylglucosamine diphosphorylase/glucosamine-1-phosphate N-acetyltransferase GlmU [Leuconostoc lactis]WKY78911.1 bifunctional UDP-N-acetylglucosamine diphosphorylase/glucosamine-1-phosphate N-acetyltransferase GlmU [Leuconostoc lactis]HBP97616.1 bifunctional UDP-N-acetylglucosamine diphosphorylase/glucosamine-1-phosphate N-acetyltransferase G
MNDDVNVLVLAAGHGSRMRSTTPKVLHRVAGKTMIDWVLDAVAPLTQSKPITVIGVGAESVQAHVGDRSDFVLQTEQLGTGHAVQQAQAKLGDNHGVTLIMSGDTPMFRPETLAEFVQTHQNSKNAVTVLTAIADDPTGYGRIVRADDDTVLKIVEQKDASVTERRIQEINTGVYVFDNQLLFEALSQVKNNNAQGEYYLPDTLDILRQSGHQIGAHTLHDFTESLGVNDRVALAVANRVMHERINHRLMVAGVELIDPANTYIDADVTIGADTIVEGGVTILGHTTIGQNNVITQGSRIEDSQIGDDNVITASHIESAVLADRTTIGPYAHLRPKAELGDAVHVGNFVEVKQAKLAANTKAGHLTYIGNADVGESVNIGAGTIFVNYDGVNKFNTTVGDRAFIGSNTKLVAPVTIADEAITAAGSTITTDVPTHAMGIARSRQVNKADFWDRMPHK